jgi:hypothetical protein
MFGLAWHLARRHLPALHVYHAGKLGIFYDAGKVKMDDNVRVFLFSFGCGG